MVMQNFGVTNKERYDSYSIFWSGWSIGLVSALWLAKINDWGHFLNGKAKVICTLCADVLPRKTMAIINDSSISDGLLRQPAVIFIIVSRPCRINSLFCLISLKFTWSDFSALVVKNYFRQSDYTYSFLNLRNLSTQCWICSMPFALNMIQNISNK